MGERATELQRIVHENCDSEVARLRAEVQRQASLWNTAISYWLVAAALVEEKEAEIARLRGEVYDARERILRLEGALVKSESALAALRAAPGERERAL